MFRRRKPVESATLCGVEGCQDTATSVWNQGYTWKPECSGEAETIRMVVPVAMCDTHFALIKRIMGIRNGETTAPTLHVFDERDLETVLREEVFQVMEEERERRTG